MSKTFDQGKDEIAKLCRYFATNRQAFLAPGVKEAHVRQSLIDPFFEALGWDVRNAAMVAPQYREVVPEDSLDVEGQQKAPDYTFRVGSQPKFYAEAKKCGININADPGPAYQLRRYGWSAKVVLSILTDFDEFGVYDCTSRPRIGDKASNARLNYYRSEEYPDRWRELWDIFSREAVWSGLFDQYAASKRKRGSSEVDAEFLKEIEGWRDALARNIALRNTNLSLDDLNAAVQLTIDRIVFLRMAEDRGIEPYEQLLKLCERPDIYSRFMRDLCRKADEKYNSGLFHFQKEAGIPETPDKITPNLDIDDKVIKPILQGLYFEFGSPYHFGVFPVEILGTVYERFLGKVIRLTEGHQAKIEEKPEVRKAGGVYYTPSYIVDYIVKNTVGKQIKGKSPAQLAGGKSEPPFRVLDMACGSGSFLLGAYQCLLDHCLNWYLENKPEAHKKVVYNDPRKSQWRLTIEEKKRILTDHIFGVDIDPQAVEVSKLSLLLKVLEGETDQTFGLQMQIFQERALPNLSENIKCGNSLISPDFYRDKNLSLYGDAEMKKTNAFDWHDKENGFWEIMTSGGFDVVIGNPPYGTPLTYEEKAYFEKTYKTFEYQRNSFSFFIERAILLSNRTGLISYIVPAVFLAQHYFFNLRKYILANCEIQTLISLNFKVFQDADIGDTSIFVFSRTQNAQVNNTIKCTIINNSQDLNTVSFLIKKQSEFTINPRFEFYLSANTGILNKIQSISVSLGKIANCTMGIKPYQKGKGKPKQNVQIISKRIFDSTIPKNTLYKKYLIGKDIDRYIIKPKEKKFIKYGDWLAEPRPGAPFERIKILVRQTSDIIRAAIDDDKYYNLNNIYNIELLDNNYDYRYLLGILNSKLMVFIYQTIVPEKGRLFAEIKKVNLDKIPIRLVNQSSQKVKDMSDRLIALVNQMLDAQKAHNFQKINFLDNQIDQLVYELYGLTKEEIRIVEEETK